MLDKNKDTDAIGALNAELAHSKANQHLWRVFLKNGSLIEFTAGWHGIGNNPSPSQFLREFDDYQATGKLPKGTRAGHGHIYRFPKTQTGSILAIDLREIVAIHVEFKS